MPLDRPLSSSSRSIVLDRESLPGAGLTGPDNDDSARRRMLSILDQALEIVKEDFLTPAKKQEEERQMVREQRER